MTDVPPRTGPDHCAKCRKQFVRGDVLHNIMLVCGVGASTGATQQSVYVSIYEEFGHISCADPKVENPFLDTTGSNAVLDLSKIVYERDPNALRARTPDWVCVRCKERLKRGDRIISVAIVEGMARAPDGTKGVQCAAEYETIHFDCRDRDLSGGT